MKRLVPGVIATAVLSFVAAVPGESGFAPPVDYSTGTRPQSVAIGDFDGDGTLDLAVTNSAPESVSVLLGLGNGTFQAAVTHAVGGSPAGVAVGDFDGDGRPDLVVACVTSHEISILLGNGNGTFQAAMGYSVGRNPTGVAVGDFNRDGRQDVAVANFSSANVSILLGNGNGTLQEAVHYGVGAQPVSIAVSDFDGDGKPDMAVTNSASGSVSILLGNGDGTFPAPVNYAAGKAPVSIAVSDFNRDGEPDLAVGNLIVGNPNLQILLGVGNGTFQAAVSYLVENNAISVVPGDFDGDGRQDLALANLTVARVSILRGRGDGTFRAGVSYEVGRGPVSLAAGDLDRDGQLDLVSANQDSNNVSVLLNDAMGAVCTGGAAVPYGTGLGPYPVAVGDFNRDGAKDLAVSNVVDDSVSILLGYGNGTFQGKVDHAVGSAPSSVAVADFNRDGMADLAVANKGSDTVSILLGIGDGAFGPPTPFPASDPAAVVASDFNGDGKADLAAVDGAFGGGVRILLGNGDGTFTTGQFANTEVLGTAVAVADFNADGRVDLAVATFGFLGPGDVHLLLGNGEGMFAPALTLPMGGRANSVAAGDFNRDGHPDLAVATYDSNSVAVLLGDGAGGFVTAVPYATGMIAAGVAVADLDRDGIEDLAVANSGSGEISVLAGLGDGTFGPAVNTLVTFPLSVAVGDFNGDGTPDLVAPSNTTPEVAVLLGTCQFPTATAVSSSRHPSFLGQPVTFTATVTSGYGGLAGAVTFKDGTTALGTVALSEGSASLTTSALSVASHSITAEYSGAPSFFSSTSGTLTQVVKAALRVDDVRLAEGNSGTSQALFVVRLATPVGQTVTVDYQTVAGSATESSDYLRASGTLTFLPGVTVRNVSVTVLGDATPEPNEAFFFRLQNPVNAAVAARPAQATIVDDDATSGVSRFQASWHPFFAVNTLETPFVGDFNGDGKTDIITFTRQNPLAFGDVYVSLSTGTQFGPSMKWHDFFAINTSEQVVIGDFSSGSGFDGIATWLADTTRQVYVTLSFGSGLSASMVWQDSIGFAPSDVLAAGDVNGDGFEDLVLFARTQGKVYAALSNNVSFGPPTLWHNFFAVSTYERPAVADLNGDGKADIVTFASDSPTAFGDVYVALSDGTKFGDGRNSDKWHDFFAIRQTEVVRIGDGDGDGKDDFFTFLPSPFAQCYTSRSTGTSMGPSVLWPEPVSPDPSDRSFVGDVNGDGRADIITFAQAEGRVYVSLAP